MIVSGSSIQKQLPRRTISDVKDLLGEGDIKIEVLSWSEENRQYLYENGSPEPCLNADDLDGVISFLEGFKCVIFGDSFLSHLARTTRGKKIKSLIVANGSGNFMHGQNLRNSLIIPSRSNRCPSFPCANLGSSFCDLECTPKPEAIVDDYRRILLL